MATLLLTPSVGFQNFYSTALTSDITAVALDVFVDTVPSVTEGVLIINPDSASLREVIYFSSKTGTKVVCPANGRGYDDTTATSHTGGTKVIMAPVADYFNAIKTGQIIADAAITPAKWTNPYCFAAYGSGTTQLTDETAVKIAFATETYDYNSNFASSTYTAPVTGVYHFDALVTNSGAFVAPLTFFMSLYKNGVEFRRGLRYRPSTIGNESVSISTDVLLAAGNTVDIYVYQDSGGNETTEIGEAVTWFNGHLVHIT